MVDRRRARTRKIRLLATVGLSGLTLTAALLSPPVAPSAPVASPASSGRNHDGGFATAKHPTAYGYGGAVSSVDPEATRAGLSVLRQGGNAVDAAVATAAALGVTEPYSAGIGGGGYFVYYDAKHKKISTLDGRETAPGAIKSDAFIDPATGKPYPFTPDLVTSGVSVGVPGTPATWQGALRRWGRFDLARALKPAERIADRGFVVDDTFHGQTMDNKDRFSQISSTAKLYLPGGDAPKVGSVFRNPELASTYRELGQQGTRAIYRGDIGREIVATVQNPPKISGATLPVPPGSMTSKDLRRYTEIRRKPTKIDYRGLQVYGMAPSSSGGIAVGEALNILEQSRLSSMSTGNALHHYLDASSLAFADRNAYVGDPAFVKVPTKRLLSDRFAASRACQIPADTALALPAAAGDLSGRGCQQQPGSNPGDTGTSTTHLVTSDRWGNVVSYTLTNEQTGGSGIVVPGRGFLLNNELTDFTTEYKETDPNRIQPGKRPRSSISPTIVLRDGRPVLAVGSPGGATIITTVLQTLINRIDLGMSLPEAVAAPRASAQNKPAISAEPGFIKAYGDQLAPYDYQLTELGDTFTSANEIGAVAALEFKRNGAVLAVAEPKRRGGGDAGVVWPR